MAHAQAQSRGQEETKIGWMAAGYVFLALAVVGLALPVIPQVPFAIVAAYCFSKGSPKLHRWMLNHKKMGPPIRDWEEHRVVRPKLKVISAVTMTIGSGIAFYMLREKTEWLQWGVPVVIMLSLVFVLTRKSKP